jgi:hypothetical protein
VYGLSLRPGVHVWLTVPLINLERNDTGAVNDQLKAIRIRVNQVSKGGRLRTLNDRADRADAFLPTNRINRIEHLIYLRPILPQLIQD